MEVYHGRWRWWNVWIEEIISGVVPFEVKDGVNGAGDGVIGGRLSKMERSM